MEDMTKVFAAAIIAIGMILGLYLVSQSLKLSPNVYVTNSPTDHSVSVSATNTQKVSPDLLQLQIRVETDSQNARTSQSDNARVMADLKSKLLGAGVKEEDIQTTSYNVQPNYESRQLCPYQVAGAQTTGASGSGVAVPTPAPDYYPTCKWDSVITGYKTIHTLMVSTTQLSKGGDLVDLASSAGNNQTFVDYVSFTLQDSTRDEIQKTLLKSAAAAAKLKAGKIAEGLGVALGKVLSASESYGYNYPQPMYLNRMAADSVSGSVPTQLSSGQIEVSASVSASYELGN